MEERDIYEAVGRVIRAEREYLGVTQQQLADAAGLKRTYLSGIENGKRKPSLAQILELADGLDQATGALVARVEAELYQPEELDQRRRRQSARLRARLKELRGTESG